MLLEEKIEKWKKDWLSLFCLYECDGNCCKKPYNYIRISQEQLQEIFKHNQNPDLEIPSLTYPEYGKESYCIKTFQNKKFPYCPAYDPKTKKCLIQKNKPKICLEFPIKIVKNDVWLNSECLLANFRNSIPFKELIKICQNQKCSLFIADEKIV